MNIVKIILLFIISIPVFSRAWGAVTKIERSAWLVRKVIEIYRSHYSIDMKQYQGSVNDYKSLSAFFTRPLNELERPLKKDSEMFLSPCDGLITVLEKIYSDTAMQVKGKRYKVSEMVRHELDLSEGYFVMTIYLSPKDYHRFHVPSDSEAVSYIHTGWRLFPVNNLSVNLIDDLFIKNERVAVKFNSSGSSYYYVAVGATFVGSIKMKIFDKPVDSSWTAVNRKFNQNDEFGMFEMGSTIVLVIPQKMVEKMKVSQGDVLKTGEALFSIKK